MAAGLVSAATSEKLLEMDWGKNIEICELVARDHRQARNVIKAIKKQLVSKHPNTQLYAVTLLEMLIHNVGDPVHTQVVDTGVLPVLVKIVKKKSDLPVREKIFLLLDAAQTSVGGASGRFPQFYSAYYELVSAGVKFPRRPNDAPINQSAISVNNNNARHANHAAVQNERNASQVVPEKIPDSSIIQKAEAALEVLSDVLDTIDSQHSEGAKDEFTLDLVEQCSFQKQRVMQLALTSREEKVVAQAIQLNEDLERVLKRHDALLAGRPTSTSNYVNHDTEEEEEAEQLSRRIRKGKACMRSEDESPQIDRSLGLLRSHALGEIANRPLIRPLSVETKQDSNGGRPTVASIVPPPAKHFERETEHDIYGGPLTHPVSVETKPDTNGGRPAVASIPPPPAKHFERERYFQENKVDGSTLPGQMGGLSLHSRNGSSSLSGSIDFSD